MANAHQPRRLDSLPVERWKNGKGGTRVIAEHTSPGTPDFTWRISLANFSDDVQFSLFPGVDRTSTVISEHGFSLVDEQGIAHELQPLCPFNYEGELPLNAQVSGKEVKCLNVMTRRGLVDSQVNLASGSVHVSPAKIKAIIAIGHVAAFIDGKNFQSLRSGEVLVVTGDESLSVVSSDENSRFIIIRIWTH